MKFELIRDLDDGQRILISAHGSRIEAERQAQDLNVFWPGIYVIREAPYLDQPNSITPEPSVRDSHA
jgi:hypothetical protein